MTRNLSESSWIQTYPSGQVFYLFDPKPVDFVLRDIAHALSMQCRYNGFVRAFYSVAQHSVHVAQCVRDRFGITDQKVLRTALLHDAAEAYLGDMVRPLKMKDDFFREVEHRMEAVIAETFDLCWPYPPEIKRADNALLAAERRALKVEPLHPWVEREEPWPMPGALEPWDQNMAKSTFFGFATSLGAA